MKLQYISSPKTQSILEALDMLHARQVALDRLIDSLQEYQSACDDSAFSPLSDDGERSERRLAS